MEDSTDNQNELTRIVEREGWPKVLSHLHNLAQTAGRSELIPGLAAACDEAKREHRNENVKRAQSHGS